MPIYLRNRLLVFVIKDVCHTWAKIKIQTIILPSHKKPSNLIGPEWVTWCAVEMLSNHWHTSLIEHYNHRGKVLIFKIYCVEYLLKIRILKIFCVKYFENQSIQKFVIFKIFHRITLNILIFNKYSPAVYFEYLPFPPVLTKFTEKHLVNLS